ncbi:ABC transporter permease [Cryptosporangium aurantiacum]|uniref:ABC transporter permease n=1 Tax=Cryptosporangium aurantiacum TaxID=134849 RepID=UPI001C49CDB4|nr:ABC transporter permease [Cryptosporangium aurantiacum]
MSSTMLEVGPRLAVGLVVLTLIAAVVAGVGQLGPWRSIPVAAVRATVQLGIVSLLIAAIVSSLWFTTLFVVAMVGTAAWTSGQRITRAPTRAERGTAALWAALPIACGSVPIVLGLIVGGLVPVRGIAIVPIAGILIGGAMTATSLAGRRALDELETRHGEVEAALSLGFTDRDAALEICRPSAGQALVPALDQTRTVGLVTLPGAFVGVLLGGGSAVEAGATQLLVLIGLLAVESIAIVVVTELAARSRLTRHPASA